MADTPNETPTTETPTTETAPVEPAPFFGEETPSETPNAEAPAEATPPADKPIEEADYLVDFEKDESVDKELIKHIAPKLKEFGIKPTQVSEVLKMAAAYQSNALKAQTEAMRNERLANFKADRELAEKEFSPADWADIRAGIKAETADNGVARYLLTKTELGANIEILRLFKKLGAAHREDAVSGAANGSGAGVGDGNSFDGLSKLW